MQRRAVSGLRHPARTQGEIPLVPPVPARHDGRSRTDPPAPHSRMAGADHRGDPDRNCACPGRLDGRSAARRRGARHHARASVPGALPGRRNPDPRHHVVADIPYPAPAARRGGHPHGQIQDRAHAAGDRFVLVLPHNLHMGRNPRRGNGGDPGPRIEPHSPPPLPRADRHGNHESRPVVEPLRMDSRTAADRGRGIRGRQRRAHERLRQGRIHANDLQAAFRL